MSRKSRQYQINAESALRLIQCIQEEVHASNCLDTKRLMLLAAIKIADVAITKEQSWIRTAA